MQIGLTVGMALGLVAAAMLTALAAGTILDLDVGMGGMGLAVGILDTSAVDVAVGLVADTQVHANHLNRSTEYILLIEYHFQ